MAKNSIQKARADKDSIEIHSYEQESPLPSPQEMKDYSSVDPSLIPFFMELALKEQEARHEVMRASIAAKEREDEVAKKHLELLDKNERRNFRNATIGQIFALACFLGSLGLCWYALSKDAYWWAGALTALSIGMVVQAFLPRKDDKQ